MGRVFQKGLTMIELMIVVVIIGILASLALPAYQDYIQRSQISEAMILTGGSMTSWLDNLEGTVCPANSTAAVTNVSSPLPVFTEIKGKYVSSVLFGGNAIIASNGDISGCTALATFNATASGSGIAGKSIFFDIKVSNGFTYFNCRVGFSNVLTTVPDKFLPKTCD